ncbi:succinate dehydrogenase, hydrophobic membrane anchor protein, partial [Staphylococcus aureus]
LPLSIWFVYNLITRLLASDAGVVGAWLGSPLVALAMVALVIALFAHARLGVQVIIEDYVHCQCKKIALLVLTNAAILI